MASDTATAPAEVASSGEAISPLAWRTLAVVLVGLFMGLLDTTIVNVALPSIGVGLRASSSQLAWVVSGYAMAFGLMLIPAGRLGDAFGHRRMYAIGLSVFALASLVCGLTQNPTELVAARVVQGIAAGSFYPTIAAFIQSLFAVPQRKRAFGVLGAVIGVSTAVGPLLGGFIIELAGVTKGWRWVFLVNVPIGLVAVPLALRLLPDNPDDQCDRQHGRFDLVGLLLFWLAGWLAGVAAAAGRGTGSRLAALDVAQSILAAVLLVAVWQWERHVLGADRTPAIPISLYRHRAFAAGNVVALAYFAAFTSVFFTFSLLWQRGLGHSALAAGLTITPFALGSLVTASNSDKLSQRLGRKVLILGISLLTAGLAAVVIILSRSGNDPSSWALVLPLLIGGLGNGMFIAPNTDFVLATVDRSEAGAASGMLSTIQRIRSARPSVSR